jgi:predicted AlkP superfamily pyrophosphatase or phosphodiesterase
MRRIISLLFFIVCASAAAIVPAKPERHVVVVVWDGMRPDFVNEQNTPTLWKLAREGVMFRNHHAVYPSATNVNGTAMVTGVYPGKSGIIANYVYRPDIDSHHAVAIELPSVVEKGDQLSGGKYIFAPTIAELVQRADARSLIASAKTVGLLLDRQLGVRRKVGDLSSQDGKQQNAVALKNSVTLSAGHCLPNVALAPITAALGPFPRAHLQKDPWTTKALIELLWKEGVPALSILWLGQPDLTQHETAPGAPAAIAAINSADKNLAAVLSALDEHTVRETTDVFVVSDHGFSTIRRSIDLRKILNEAGFDAATKFDREPKPGDIMLVGNGGSVLFYVIGRDATVTHRLVEFLQQSDFAGVIFTRKSMEGTFQLDQAKIDNDRAPDVVMTFRWDDSKNQFGVPGMIYADWQRAAGEGTHATLSRFDMHNTFIAAGPDFKRGETNNLPSGNVDLAPTILEILGIKPPHKMDGRILSEVMTDAAASQEPETKRIEATKHFPSGTWRQSLQILRVGSTIYLDEGNGAFVANEPAANELQRDR